MYAVAACLLLSLCSQDGSSPDIDAPVAEAPVVPVHLADQSDLLAFLPRLRGLMEAGIECAKPSSHFTRKLETKSPFSGSYDYHSCVIAHWALLVISRLESDAELEERMLARLDGETLQRELEMLASLEHGKRMTYPYDVAWLCMLLSELDRHEAADLDVVEQFRIEVEAQMLDYLENQPLPERFPSAERGGKEFNGFYRSWLFTYLLLAWSEPIGDGAGEALNELYAQRIAGLRPAMQAQIESHGFDFLWVPAVSALIDRCMQPGVEREPYRLRAEADVGLPATVKISTVHILGMHLCRLWPLAADGAAGEEASLRAYLDGMGTYLEREDLWAEDFAVVTHWVPQFIWIGLWLALDRP